MYEQVLASDKTSDITNNPTGTGYVRYAKVVNVYDSTTINTSTNYGKVDLVWLDTMDAVNGSISITQPMYSNVHGCGIYSLPCVNDVAVCLQQQDGPPIIMGFLPVNQYVATTSGQKDGSGQIGYMPKIKSGEILIKSKSKSHIYFKNDGSINIRAYDGNNTVSTLSEDVALNSEPIIERTSASEDNVVVDVTLGSREGVSGQDVNRGNSVFSLLSGPCVTGTASFSCIRNQATFIIQNTNNNEIVDIDFITIKSANSGDSKSTTIQTFTKGFSFHTEYSFISTGDSNSGSINNTCTMDSNNNTTFITLDNELSKLVAEGSILSVQYKQRNATTKIGINSSSDIVVDGTNIILRSNGGSSYLGLFADGRVQIGGSQVEIGDRLRGSIRTNSSGVLLSAGAMDNARVHVAQVGEGALVDGPVSLFYISESYPLFSYDYREENPRLRYQIVSAATYLALSDRQRTDILPRCFDPEDAENGFTHSLADSLITATVQAGLDVTAYGILKTL